MYKGYSDKDLQVSPVRLEPAIKTKMKKIIKVNNFWKKNNNNVDIYVMKNISCK